MWKVTLATANFSVAFDFFSRIHVIHPYGIISIWFWSTWWCITLGNFDSTHWSMDCMPMDHVGTNSIFGFRGAFSVLERRNSCLFQNLATAKYLRPVSHDWLASPYMILNPDYSYHPRKNMHKRIGQKITKSIWTPTGWSAESPYTHSMKTKIGGIESPMLGASYASKISHGNHPCGTHQEV